MINHNGGILRSLGSEDFHLVSFQNLGHHKWVSNVRFYDFQADLCKSLVVGPNIPTTFYTEGNNATSKQRIYLNLVGQALVGRPGGFLGGR